MHFEGGLPYTSVLRMDQIAAVRNTQIIIDVPTSSILTHYMYVFWENAECQSMPFILVINNPFEPSVPFRLFELIFENAYGLEMWLTL